MTTTYSTDIRANGVAISAPVYGNGTPYYRLKGNNVDYIHKYKSADVKWNIMHSIRTVLTIRNIWSDCSDFYADGQIRVYGESAFISTGSEGSYSIRGNSLSNSGRGYIYLETYHNGVQKGTQLLLFKRNENIDFDFTVPISDLWLGNLTTAEYKLYLKNTDDVMQFATSYYITNPAHGGTSNRRLVSEWGASRYSLGTFNGTGTWSSIAHYKTESGSDTGPYQEY